MAQVESNMDSMKQIVKEALSETLYENREVLHEILAEVLEDFALAEAVREGRESRIVERDEVMQILRAPQ